MFDRFLGKDHQRRRALAKASPGPLADYLATPLPNKDRDCRQMELVALDLETTGLDPETDVILSIGLVHIVDWSVKLATSWHRVVQVERAIPGNTAVIHQITDDRAAAGTPLDALLPEVLTRLAGKPMVAHYAVIEQGFLNAACERVYGAPFVAPVIDTLVLGQRIFERRNHLIQPHDLRLFNLRPRYNLPQYKAHNALSDALATAELLLAMGDDLYPNRPCPLRALLHGR